MNPQFIFSCKEENLSKIEDGKKELSKHNKRNRNAEYLYVLR